MATKTKTTTAEPVSAVEMYAKFIGEDRNRWSEGRHALVGKLLRDEPGLLKRGSVELPSGAEARRIRLGLKLAEVEVAGRIGLPNGQYLAWESGTKELTDDQLDHAGEHSRDKTAVLFRVAEAWLNLFDPGWRERAMATESAEADATRKLAEAQAALEAARNREDDAEAARKEAEAARRAAEQDMAAAQRNA